MWMVGYSKTKMTHWINSNVTLNTHNGMVMLHGTGDRWPHAQTCRHVTDMSVEWLHGSTPAQIEFCMTHVRLWRTRRSDQQRDRDRARDRLQQKTRSRQLASMRRLQQLYDESVSQLGACKSSQTRCR